MAFLLFFLRTSTNIVAYLNYKWQWPICSLRRGNLSMTAVAGRQTFRTRVGRHGQRMRNYSITGTYFYIHWHHVPWHDPRDDHNRIVCSVHNLDPPYCVYIHRSVGPCYRLCTWRHDHCIYSVHQRQNRRRHNADRMKRPAPLKTHQLWSLSDPSPTNWVHYIFPPWHRMKIFPPDY